MNRPILRAALAGGVLAALALLPQPAQPQALGGFDVYRSNCGGCHELYDPESPRRSRTQWQAILTRMVKERGATLNQQEFTAVLNYLDSFNRPRREIQWVEAPAKSRQAKFLVADSGKLPAEWVDITIGADAQVPWAVQVSADGKAAYVSPLKAAEENQFPALIDNTGLMENGSVLARMQLLSGKGAVGAGVLFGFRNPQSFYGVRIGPRDVVMYEVQGGQRALLARQAMSLPLKQWHTLGIDVAGKEVRVSVNGKPVPSLTRTLSAYRGGRTGVHTQGDTAAVFDQWQLTVR